MRPTFKVILFARKVKEGKQPVFLRVTFARESKYFTLNRYCQPALFDKKKCRFRAGYPDHIAENDVLLAIEKRAADYIRNCERENLPFDFVAFERAVFTQTASGGALAWEWFEEVSRTFEAEGKAGNADIYRTLANAVRLFAVRASLAQIDLHWLSKFEAFLRKRGANDGGISVYMKTLHAACVRAVKAGKMQKGWQPFDGYSLAHLERKKKKRAVGLDVIRRLRDAVPETAFQAFARDLFMFSFYAWGMNLADIAALRRENIRNLRIEYRRQKTGMAYSVNLSAAAAAIVDRYNTGGEYLFPIYLPHNDSARKRKNRLKYISAKVNAALREVCDLCGIPSEGFTFYIARHTYATALKRAGFAHTLIQDVLGHSSPAITEGYLASFEQGVLDEANAQILEGLG